MMSIVLILENGNEINNYLDVESAFETVMLVVNELQSADAITIPDGKPRSLNSL